MPSDRPGTGPLANAAADAAGEAGSGRGPTGGAPARAHPFSVVFVMVRVARSLIFPAAATAVAAGGGEPRAMLAWGAAVLGIPSLLIALARFWAFRYRLGPAELVVDSGVLRRRRRVLPVDRLQNVAIEQNAVQRILGVVELRTETATGGEKELAVVLSRAAAEALRDGLLARRAAAHARAPGEPARATPDRAPSRPPPLARPSTGELLRAGATSNEAGVLAALLAGALQLATRLRIPLPDAARDPRLLFPELPPSLALALLVALFLAAGWLFSVAGAVIRYHGFALERAGDELRKRHGLLDRREATIPLRRVQAVRIEESLLRRPFGLVRLVAETAGGVAGAGRRGEVLVPIARRHDVPRLLEAALDLVDPGAIRLEAVHPRTRRRAFIRYALVLTAAAAAAVVAADAPVAWLLAPWPVAYAGAVLHYRPRAYALTPDLVVARAGFLNRVTAVVPRAKIQTLHAVESPFQRRQDLATLLVDTAGGGARIGDLGRADAFGLLRVLAGAAAAPGDPAAVA